MRIRHMLGCTAIVYQKGSIACGLSYAIVRGTHATERDAQQASRGGVATIVVRLLPGKKMIERTQGRWRSVAEVAARD